MTREFHPEAERELDQSARWYAEQSLFAAERFLKGIQNAIDSVMHDPARYQPVGEGVRVFRLTRFPYKLFYEFDEGIQHVRILCVMHNRRRPDYWHDRIEGRAS